MSVLKQKIGDVWVPVVVGATGPTGATGATGPTGAAGSDAAVTNANVNSAISANVAATKAVLAIDQGDVGLSAVNNTADIDKPVSTAQAAAIAAAPFSSVGLAAGLAIALG